MCGINGIFAYHHAANPVDRAELIRTRDHMAARGPDGEGEWIAGGRRIGFGHRRLSIIDLSETGAQPMTSADGKLVVTFNGEIYNYRALREHLESIGRKFRSQSDTEVLLHLYAEKGAAMVHELRGMFAFAIWDAVKRQLFLARDPYGIKPLYYADDGSAFRFASQVKALLSGGAISQDPEPAGMVGFYLWGSVPEPFTTWRVIRALPAGTTLLVDDNGARDPQRYHSIASVYKDAERSKGSAASVAEQHAQVRAALRDSIRHHLIADVPVGAFLSAGVDSSALVGMMRESGQEDIQTVTLSFEEFRGQHDDETPLAAQVARLYGTRHTNRIISEAEFKADLPLILAAMDQPSIDGINTWFVSKAARELGLKVAVSGLGGDELFGGYPSFRNVPRMVSAMALPGAIPGLGNSWRRLACAFGLERRGIHPKLASVLEFGGTYAGAYLLRRGVFMPWELGQFLEPETVREGLAALAPLEAADAALAPRPRTAFGKVAVLEASLYMRNQLLRDADWASMAHSLEVRFPLVDATLLSALAPITVAAGRTNGKAALAAAPRIPLPEEIVNRRKTGFTTPIASWLKQGWPPREKPRVPPGLLASSCPWARCWAYCVASQSASQKVHTPTNVSKQ